MELENPHSGARAHGEPGAGPRVRRCRLQRAARCLRRGVPGAVPDLRGGTAVDLGCGAADIAVRFARAHPGVGVHGVDGSAAMLELGRAHVEKSGLEARITLQLARLPVAEPRETLGGPFAAVITNSLLHHLARPDGAVAHRGGSRRAGRAGLRDGSAPAGHHRRRRHARSPPTPQASTRCCRRTSGRHCARRTPSTRSRRRSKPPRSPSGSRRSATGISSHGVIYADRHGRPRAHPVPADLGRQPRERAPRPVDGPGPGPRSATVRRASSVRAGRRVGARRRGRPDQLRDERVRRPRARRR